MAGSRSGMPRVIRPRSPCPPAHQGRPLHDEPALGRLHPALDGTRHTFGCVGVRASLSPRLSTNMVDAPTTGALSWAGRAFTRERWSQSSPSTATTGSGSTEAGPARNRLPRLSQPIPRKYLGTIHESRAPCPTLNNFPHCAGVHGRCACRLSRRPLHSKPATASSGIFFLPTGPV